MGRPDEDQLVEDMTELARQYGRYGYLRIAALLREAGWQVNDKRDERLWRRERLKVHSGRADTVKASTPAFAINCSTERCSMALKEAQIIIEKWRTITPSGHIARWDTALQHRRPSSQWTKCQS